MSNLKATLTLLHRCTEHSEQAISTVRGPPFALASATALFHRNPPKRLNPEPLNLLTCKPPWSPLAVGSIWGRGPPSEPQSFPNPHLPAPPAVQNILEQERGRAAGEGNPSTFWATHLCQTRPFVADPKRVSALPTAQGLGGFRQPWDSPCLGVFILTFVAFASAGELPQTNPRGGTLTNPVCPKCNGNWRLCTDFFSPFSLSWAGSAFIMTPEGILPVKTLQICVFLCSWPRML